MDVYTGKLDTAEQDSRYDELWSKIRDLVSEDQQHLLAELDDCVGARLSNEHWSAHRAATAGPDDAGPDPTAPRHFQVIRGGLEVIERQAA